MHRSFLSALALAVAAHSAEPWADARMPLKDPAVWLDASVQKAAHTARKRGNVGGELDVWFDASGHRRDVTQAVVDFRPKFVASEGGAYVRFDGKDDFLAASPATELSEATIFVVAAPRANPGFFPGFFAMNRSGHDDYSSGLNLDLGGSATPTFSVLNSESAGAAGQRNLLKTQFDFGTFHVFTLTAARDSIRLRADGVNEGKRERKAEPIGMDELTVGARRYSHVVSPPYALSFFDGDIAELLVFPRVLPDAERDGVERYLIAKHSGTRAVAGDKPLVAVKDPPPVQMLVPGFVVRELPLKMTNIDCLRYRHDGVLVAGAYNGKIWLLRDTDGDGSEDKAELYWESADLKHVIGMDLTPKGDPRGPGVFVATAGRILFIPDKNGDDRGDEQRVIASGWEKQKLPGGGGSVDALGLAVGPDGSVYFGLGVSAFANAYELEDGKAKYRLESERGTVQRILPDFSKRETICTGIRYPVGAAFNRHGDLFMTDQEGATWLPNGNPFDELLHIEKGRHYGFPPRHPVHLPNVVDEPSVFDYGPQHQSTCGLVFNSAPKTFGPDWWRDDAFVAGEARGKIYRTKLVKTAHGYVAQNQLIGCTTMLAVDVAISHRGDLLVACHSGAPDWGTGPEGAGKIFRITATPAPRPVATYFASPGELRVTFDAELDATKLRDVAKKTDITAGRYVAAGDRFESIRPGYQVVRDQMAARRRDVPVLGASLSADKRSITFAVPPQTAMETYAVTMPDFTKPAGPHTQIDLAADMSGVEAAWTSADGKTKWQGWLPHLDLAVAKAFTAGSAEHAGLWEQLNEPGVFAVKGQLDLWEMLQPAIQPGAQLDYTRPLEEVVVGVKSNSALLNVERTVDLKERSVTVAPTAAVIHRGEVLRGKPKSFAFGTTKGADAPTLAATYRTPLEAGHRPVHVRRFFPSWAKAADDKQTLVRKIEGDWLAGRRLYFGKALCGTCHTIHGEGGSVGPELSNLAHRDFASVERDIRDPSAALNPDHISYHIAMKDGSEFAAVLLTEDKDKLRIGEATGAVRDLARSDVRELKALPVSLMPPALLDGLTPDERRDVMAFLLSPPPLAPAPIEAPNPPPARKRAEVEAVLNSQRPTLNAQPPMAAAPLRVLIVSAKKDHGPGEHDYPLFQKRWSTLLGLAPGVSVAQAQDWPSAEQFAAADVAVFYSNNPAWNPDRKRELDAFLQRGGGAVFIHWAIEGREFAPELAECIGLASNSKALKYRHGAITMTFPNAEHPITRGFKTTDFVDETYWQAVGDPARITLLGEVLEDAAPRPQLWAREHGKGRVFVSIPGHYTWTFDDPLHRVLLLRGICWTARQPVDRLSELATIGARVER